jgi:hypothetical protein
MNRLIVCDVIPHGAASCDGGGGGGGGGGGALGPLLVFDSTGALVGQLIDFARTGSTPFGARVVVQKDVLGEPRIFIIEVRESEIRSPVDVFGQDNAWSLDNFCGDPLYMVPQNSVGLEAAFVVDGIAYLPDTGFGRENIVSESRLSHDGVCTDTAASDVSLLPTVSIDLASEFTPPFRVGF